MSSRDRKMLIVGIVLLVLAGGVFYLGYRKVNPPGEVIDLKLPPGSSPKAQWQREQKAGSAAGAASGSAPTGAGAASAAGGEEGTAGSLGSPPVAGGTSSGQ